MEIVEYFEGNESHFAKKLEEKDNRLSIEKASKQKLKLSTSRVLFYHQIQSNDNLTDVIDELIKKIESRKKDFSVTELWDLASEDIRDYSVEELASFFFDNPDSITQSALFHCLRDEKNHFKRKGTLVTPRSSEQIEEIIIQEKKEKEKLELYNFYSNNIGLAMRNSSSVNPDIFFFLKNWLKDSSNQELTSILEKYANGQDPRFFVYNILISNNIISKDSDKFATIYGVNSDFNKEALEEANNLVIDTSSREDLSHLTSYTIDSEETKEIDDAISFDKIDDKFLLGVHITDLASFIPHDSALDTEAYERISTVYLETGEIPMFPQEICHDKLSLIKDKPRPCLSSLFIYDSNFQLLEKRITLSTITVKYKISYDEVDKLLRKTIKDKNSDFSLLKKLTDSLRNQRFTAGAIEINRPEIEIRVIDDEIKLKTISQRSPSRRIISELMILMNSTIAEYASLNKIPFIYRVQEMPNEDYKHYLQTDYYDPVMNDKLIRMLRPSIFSSQPSKHYGLGLEFYSQVTSPLRRYFDLISQRQIVSFIKENKFLYNQEELLSFITKIDETNKHYTQLYNYSFNYWFLRYLAESMQYIPLSAVVVSDNQNNYTCELLDFGKRYNIRTRESLAVGDLISLMIEKVLPEKDIIKFNLIND